MVVVLVVDSVLTTPTLLWDDSCTLARPTPPLTGESPTERAAAPPCWMPPSATTLLLLVMGAGSPPGAAVLDSCGGCGWGSVAGTCATMGLKEVLLLTRTTVSPRGTLPVLVGSVTVTLTVRPSMVTTGAEEGWGGGAAKRYTLL